ncbi:MAG: murein biosynthesis integral membrane protein MurJ [Endomicrobiales bacterium]|nr:murein biosynthesis integral membrane protein MurJ [Endomicrobiales bacterium]
MKTENTKLSKHAGLFSFGTAISRVLGFLRDMMVANFFGAGLFADAFYAAYRIPNLFRRLFGEGALSASFIPVFSEYLHTKTKEETQDLLNSIFSSLLVALAVITALGMIFAPQLVHLIAYGFTNDPDKLGLTTELTKLMFPFLLFVCLAALCLGVLSALGSFFIPAVAPASLSVAEIAFLLVFGVFMSPQNQIRGLAISVIAGGAMQFFWQYLAMKRLGWTLKFKLNFSNPGMKRIMLLMVPATIGLSVDQVNAFVDTICASFLHEGSITALYYSNRVMQLPLALFGIALASAALPNMSKSAAQKDFSLMKDTLNFSLRLNIFTLVPAVAGFVAIGISIIRVLFERGHFSYDASVITNVALVFYALGLPAYAFVKVLASGFYALHETSKPVKIAVVSMLLNVVMVVLSIRLTDMGVGGLALAASISSWFNAFVLAYFLRKRIGAFGGKKVLFSMLSTLAISAFMGLFAFFAMNNVFGQKSAAGLFVVIILSAVLYLFLSKVFAFEEAKVIFAGITHLKNKFLFLFKNDDL